MNPEFDPRQIPPEDYRERILALEAETASHLKALRKAEAELAWWRQGMDLFAGGAASVESPSTEAVTSPNGTKPSLREAILRIMQEGGTDTWKAPEMIEALGLRGWLPNGKNAGHIVRSRLSTLTKNGELERVGYGVYGLPKTEGEP